VGAGRAPKIGKRAQEQQSFDDGRVKAFANEGNVREHRQVSGAAPPK